MTCIFLDESGDLSFRQRSSRWFILTIALINQHRKIEECVNRFN